MDLKDEIIAHLKVLLDERMDASSQAMQAAQESANDQSKSSAGDKYETSRSMGQLDRNMHARQFEQARQERTILERIEALPEKNAYERVAVGTLVKTTAGYFFIAVSAGAILIDKVKVLAVSAASPIGQILMGKQIKESFLFQGKKKVIETIE